MNAKIVDVIIHDHSKAMARSLVNICQTVEDRRMIINALTVIAERSSDSVVEAIHAEMDTVKA